ncbi:hypothetical protein D3C75_478790 [compost metagenome]
MFNNVNKEYNIEINANYKNFFKYKIEIVEPYNLIKDWSDYVENVIEDEIVVDSDYINQSLNPYLLKVTVETVGGVTTTKNMQLSLYNTTPKISINMTGMMADIQLLDNEDDKLKYHIKLNNNKIYPIDSDATTLQIGVLNYNKLFNSREIKIGQPNILEVYAEDEYKAYDSLEYIFEGKYSGLMFSDENGVYYTTDIGELLKYLSIGKIAQGTNSNTFKILLTNTLPYTVNNITLSSENQNQDTNILLSKTISGELLSTLNYQQDLVYNGNIEFYLTVRVDKEAKSGGTAKIKVRADLVQF